MRVKDADVAKVIRRARRYPTTERALEAVVDGITRLAEDDNPKFDSQQFENETRGETA